MGRSNTVIVFSLLAFASLWFMSQTAFGEPSQNTALGGAQPQSDAKNALAPAAVKTKTVPTTTPADPKPAPTTNTPTPAPVVAKSQAPVSRTKTAPAKPEAAASKKTQSTGIQKISLAKVKEGGGEETSIMDRARSVVGLLFLLLVCWLLSNNRKIIPWRVVLWGMGLQIILGVIVMKTDLGNWFFSMVNGAFMKLLQFTTNGAGFLFGNLARSGNVPVGPGGPFGPVASSGEVAAVGAYFAFSVLPTIIFFSSLMAVLYHSGIMEKIVKSVAWVMQKTMKTSGSETLSASGNIFVGQTEAPLLVRPYVDGMTQSELMTVMTGGFATVAGGVMAAYVGMLSQWFPDIAGHLLSASVMSAPAALVCAKLMVPEPDPTKSETYGECKVVLEKIDVNIIDAAARGAGEGLKLALNVGAMLLAFLALIAMFNYLVAVPSYLQHVAALSEFRDAITQALTASPSVLKSAPGCLNADMPWENTAACIGTVSEWVSTTSVSQSVQTPSLWSVYTLQSMLGFVLQPVAWLMGVSWDQAQSVGQLLGIKTIVNEFVAYGDLAGMLAKSEVSGRSAVIATYALCGFANFGSIAIQLGGIGGIAPKRKGDLAKLGLRAMIAGTIAAMLTATVAGMLY